MTGLLPLIKRNGVRVVTNMGAANPLAGAEKIVALAQDARPEGARRGADRRRRARRARSEPAACWRPASRCASIGALFSANAYLGVEAMLPALRERRRHHSHRPRRRPLARARAACASFRLDARRRGAFRARHRRRASARMRRATHRRLLRRPGQEGRARHGDARLSVRRRRCRRQCDVLEGRRHRRRHQPHDRDRAVALRGDRSGTRI